MSYDKGNSDKTRYNRLMKRITNYITFIIQINRHNDDNNNILHTCLTYPDQWSAWRTWCWLLRRLLCGLSWWLSARLGGRLHGWLSTWLAYYVDERKEKEAHRIDIRTGSIQRRSRKKRNRTTDETKSTRRKKERKEKEKTWRLQENTYRLVAWLVDD